MSRHDILRNKAQPLAEHRSTRHADGQCLAVKEALIFGGRLKPVGDGVPVIQDHPPPPLLFILAHHCRFERGAAPDRLCGRRSFQSYKLRSLSFQKLQKLRVED